MTDLQTVDIDAAEIPRLRVGIKWDAVDEETQRKKKDSPGKMRVKLMVAATKAAMYGGIGTILRLTRLAPTKADKFLAAQKKHAAAASFLADYLEYGEAPGADLDLLCYCYDQGGNLVSLVAPYPTGLEGGFVEKKAVVHSGDEATGIRSGFDEEIAVNLLNFDDEVQDVFVAIFSVNCNFDGVPNGQCAVMSTLDEQILLERDLQKAEHQTYLFARLTRLGAVWRLLDVSDYFQVNDDPNAHHDGTIDDILRHKYLSMPV